MSRWNYFIKRVLLSVPVLFMVMTFMFIMLRMGPISPVAARLGPEATGSDVEQMQEALGLDRPLWEQYLTFMKDLILFNGESWVIYPKREIFEILAQITPPTVWLGFWAVMLPLFIGLPLGFYAGLNSNTFRDYFASIGGILWLAMPNFWLAIMVMMFLRRSQGGGLFGIDWYALGPTLPAGSITGTPPLDFYNAGWEQVIWIIPTPFTIDWLALAANIKFILPPAIVLGSASMAAELRIGRTAMLEKINANYVETAKAKGLKGRVIVWKHVFRNALIPLIPVITNEAFLLIGGSVIVEQIFNINGLGRNFFQALIQGDLPFAGQLLFLFTLLIILLNIFQDLLFTIVDPRVGYER